MAAAWNDVPATGGLSECAALVRSAEALRTSAPELSVQLARRALLVGATDISSTTAHTGQAGEARSLSMRAQAVLAAGLVRISQHVGAVEPGFAALGLAESGGALVLAAELRLDLAACAQEVGEPLLAGALLRPVLEATHAPPSVRAAALGRLVGCVAHVARRDDVEDALTEADRLLAADDSLSADARRMERARLAVRSAAYHRWYGDNEDAVTAARDGLTLLSRLQHELRAESDRLHARLVLELVCALLDEGHLHEAEDAAHPTVDEPVRATAAESVGQVMLAMATRVHLPAGEVDRGRGLLDQAAWLAERHGLDSMLADALTELSRLDEQTGHVKDALEALRAARAAEQRRMRAVAKAARHLLTQVGAGQGTKDVTQQAVAALLRQLAHPAGVPVSVAPSPTPRTTLPPSRTAQEPRETPPPAADTPTDQPGAVDESTGLLNREGLVRRLRSVRKGERPVALTLVRFEPTNDNTNDDRGPDTGIMVGLADKVRDIAPQDAELARSDGGELAVFLPHTTRDQAEEFAATIRETARESDWLAGSSAKDLSISTTVVQSDPQTPDTDPNLDPAGMLTAARDALTPAQPPAPPTPPAASTPSQTPPAPRESPAPPAPPAPPATSAPPASRAPTAPSASPPDSAKPATPAQPHPQPTPAASTTDSLAETKAALSALSQQPPASALTEDTPTTPLHAAIPGDPTKAGRSILNSLSIPTGSGGRRRAGGGEPFPGERTSRPTEPTEAPRLTRAERRAQEQAGLTDPNAPAPTGWPAEPDVSQALRHPLAPQARTRPETTHTAPPEGPNQAGSTAQAGSTGSTQGAGSETGTHPTATTYSATAAHAAPTGHSPSTSDSAPAGHSAATSHSAPTSHSASADHLAPASHSTSVGDSVLAGRSASAGDSAAAGHSAPAGHSASASDSVLAGRSALTGHSASVGDSAASDYSASTIDSASAAYSASASHSAPAAYSAPATHSASATRSTDPTSAGETPPGEQPPAAETPSAAAGPVAPALVPFSSVTSGARISRVDQASSYEETRAELARMMSALNAKALRARTKSGESSGVSHDVADRLDVSALRDAARQTIPTPPEPDEMPEPPGHPDVPEPPQRPDIPEPPRPEPILPVPPAPDSPAEPGSSTSARSRFAAPAEPGVVTSGLPTSVAAGQPTSAAANQSVAAASSQSASASSQAADAASSQFTSAASSQSAAGAEFGGGLRAEYGPVAPASGETGAPADYGTAASARSGSGLAEYGPTDPETPATGRSGLLAAFDALTGPVLSRSAGGDSVEPGEKVSFQTDFVTEGGLPSRKPLKSWAELESASLVDSPADDLFGTPVNETGATFPSSLGAAFGGEVREQPATSDELRAALGEADESPATFGEWSAAGGSRTTGTATGAAAPSVSPSGADAGPVGAGGGPSGDGREPSGASAGVESAATYDEPIGPQPRPEGPRRRGERSATTIASLLTEALAAYQSTTDEQEERPSSGERFDSFAGEPVINPGRHRSPE